MKKIVIAIGLAMLFASPSFASVKFVKETGFKCKDCHAGAAKKGTATTDKGKVSSEFMAALGGDKAVQEKLATQFKFPATDFEGKTDCKACHDKLKKK